MLGQIELEDHFEATMRYRQDKVSCPNCGGMKDKKHESTFQRKKDWGLRDKEVVLILEKRRFRCLSCGEAFTEPDEIFGTRRHSSKYLRAYLGERAMYQTVSESLGRRSFTEERFQIRG